MIADNLKLLFQLFYRPAFAMSEIIDKGSWLFAAVAVLLVSLAFFATVNSKLNNAYRIPNFYEFYQPSAAAIGDEDSPEAEAAYNNAKAEYQKALAERARIPAFGDNFFRFFSFEPNRFYQPLLSLSVFYVPIAILLLSLFGNAGSFGLLLRRDYGTLAVCALLAWAAAHLPFAIAGVLLYSLNVSPEIYFLLWLAGGALFGVFMIFALRTVFGANYAAAILVVCIAWLALSAGMYVSRFVSPWLVSPFLLFYAYIYLGGYFGGELKTVGNAFRQKQNFKRFLHNATVNPKDADAHVQLGLIYRQRRQDAKALEHLNKAIEIEPNEIDANYELGKIARAKGELQIALNHFSIIVEQNDKHALSEIWREIGATYLDANMLNEACEALEKFVERRPVDSEGLYYLGKVYKAQNEPDKAREMFERAVESAKTSPDYRRRELRQWSKLAQKEI
ncbi:MAG: tetratricopeptide repeat protein [Acidobacteriota bacterium]|nr:tetratricopeptide repeat protein [Acidobacteriota bacterium]